MNSCRSAVYAYRTAAYAVKSFAESYARAMNFTAKKLDMDVHWLIELLIRLFMYRNNAWNFVRDTIKRIEKQDMYAELAQYEGEMFRKYLTSVKSELHDEWLDSKESYF